MATKAKETETTTAAVETKEAPAKKNSGYIVTVESNPNFCGVGAGGVQFANGEARIKSERMAAWFREHKGYKVKAAN